MMEHGNPNFKPDSNAPANKLFGLDRPQNCSNPSNQPI